MHMGVLADLDTSFGIKDEPVDREIHLIHPLMLVLNTYDARHLRAIASTDEIREARAVISGLSPSTSLCFDPPERIGHIHGQCARRSPYVAIGH